MEWGEFTHSIRHVSHAQQPRIRQAFDLGAYLHREQLRKSGDPYFSHPIAVATMLAEIGADSDTIIAALLHDALEDTSLTADELETQCGPIVRQLIEGVTKLTEEELEERPTRDEQIETLRKIFVLMQNDVRIMVIKLIDRLHNMQTIAFLPADRRVSFAQETQEIFTKIADRLCMQELRDELTALSLKQLEPESFANMEDAEQRQGQLAQEIIDQMHATLRLQDSVRLEYEQKPWNQIRAQLQLSGSVVTGLAALSIVFVCSSPEECYRLLGELHGHWSREATSFQDFINAPGLNGYRGLHTTIILADGTRVRCKIRTEAMHQYARRGITTFCFGEQTQDIAQHLPWTQRISPMSIASGGKEDFWESLLNDILGDSIVIHGPADQNILVPKIATALDAAFYTFHDAAVYAEQILINGKESSFFATLSHGDSIDIIASDKPQVERKWLEWVKTGLAITFIRTALAHSHSEQEQADIGKNLFQDALHKRHKGFIEELDESRLLPILQSLGYQSLHETYLAIAQGHQEPDVLYNSIFSRVEIRNKPILCDIRYNINLSDELAMKNISMIYQTYSSQLLNVQYKSKKGANTATVRLRMNLNGEEQKRLVGTLTTVGAKDVYLITVDYSIRLWIIVAFLIIIWGIDPVLAKYLIMTRHVSAIDFTIVRFATFFLLSFIQFKSSREPQLFQKIPWSNFLLWLIGFTFVILGFATYVSLQTLLPQEYVTMVYASIIFMPLLTPFAHFRGRERTSFIAIAFGLVGLGLLKVFRMDMPWIALCMGLLVSLSFAVLTFGIDEFKRRYHVSARISAFLMSISAISLLFCVPLFPFSSLYRQSPVNLLLLTVYGFIVTGLPYHLYYRLLTTDSFPLLANYFFIGSIFTLLGQFLLFGSIELPSLISLALVCLSVWLINNHYRYAAISQFSDGVN